jgi:CheY-like chemotaxis protein
VGALLAEEALGKGLELVAYCEPDVPAAVRGDSGRIRQVLINLASNAVKFTARGEVVIRVRCRNATAVDGPAWLHFEVVDTGIGIAEEDQERLFEAFSQADASTTRQYGGTGLGLAICRRLVRLMGGRLDLDSEPGSGSTFWFDVPLTAASTPSLPVGQVLGGLTGLRVLIVDDNETNRLVLKERLHFWHMLPDSAADGASGLVQLREAAAAGQPYAMAILDMCMPEMDGLAVAQAVADDPALASTRVMILTSTGHTSLQGAGVRLQLAKPVRDSELFDALTQLAAPQVRSEDSSTPSAVSAPAIAEHFRGRVLVVEDNPVNQLVAEGVLAKLGYLVDVAANGHEALQALELTAYSAVLMDCHMPEMDGYEATGEIRRREGVSRHTPIIAMTAGVMSEDRARCIAAGMDDFVSKPVDVGVLSAVLTRWAASGGSTQASTGPESMDGGRGLVPRQGGDPLDRDRLEALRQLGPEDGWGLLSAIVGAFLDEIPARLSALRAAVQSGGGGPLAQAAHQLKGSASNVGVPAVAQLCQELEDAGGSGAPPPVELLDRLETELRRAERALTDALPVKA